MKNTMDILGENTDDFSEEPRNTMIISIIGVARDKGNELNKELYYKMVNKALEVIMEETVDLSEDLILKSGGAAWSDHIAVELFLYYGFSGLILCLPCEFNEKYHDTNFHAQGAWRTNPGYLSNLLHSQFSMKVEKNTLKEIKEAFNKGAQKIVKKGFHLRNTEVAKTDLLLAFTFGKEAPMDGGTLDTWKKARCKKIHINLLDL